MKTQDLILKTKPVEEDILKKYAGVLDVVCGEEKYFFQREAVERVLSYMLNYRDLEELVKENIKSRKIEYNKFYQEQFGERYIEKFADRNKKIGTIDLPTGTGKSFVMFAVAIILYNEIEEINRVQVIVPSKTIAKQLSDKFKMLRDKLSRMQEIKLPTLTSLHEDELKANELAIDNIHKLYETQNAQLSKEHSFGKCRGVDVLIMNDEAHHIYNAKGSIDAGGEKDLRKWFEFLMNEHYNFKYILNFTATPFEAQDKYLHNVIYRYSLNDAIQEKIVKDVRYLPQGDIDASIINAEKQQLKLAVEQLKKLKDLFVSSGIKIKPFGVVVCDSIPKAEEIVGTMKGLGVAENKVIAYTSKHLENEQLVADIDNQDNIIEWVVSVGMLTEGWDAKNVFVLVPHEERAFASKLLISQLVGRGLRRVAEVPDKLNEVLILNHRAWGEDKIRMLINEVVDVSPRIDFGTTGKYNFELHNLSKKYESFDPKLQDKVKDIDLKETLEKVFGGMFDQKLESNASLQTNAIKNSSKKIDTKHSYDGEYLTRGEILKWYKTAILPIQQIKTPFDSGEEFVDFILSAGIIKDSQVKDKLLERNFKIMQNAIASAFDGGDIEEVFDYELKEISTKDMKREGFGVDTFLNLKRENSPVWYCSETFSVKTTNQYEKLFTQGKLQLKKRLGEKTDIAKDQINHFVDACFEKIDKANKYKTPLEIVSYDSDNEKQFIERVFTNIDEIDCWIKSRTQGFYTIEMENTNFNPDFILRMNNNKILIIEIKDDNDKKILNAQKLQALEEHTKILNDELKKAGISNEYIPYLLRPKDFNSFFGEVVNDKKYKHIPDYHSELKRLLSRENDL